MTIDFFLSCYFDSCSGPVDGNPFGYWQDSRCLVDGSYYDGDNLF